jgi:hypothetical protein
LAGDTSQSWREETLAASTAELERIRAENSAVLEKFAFADITLDVASLIHGGLRAIAEVTTDDVICYARSVLADSDQGFARSLVGTGSDLDLGRRAIQGSEGRCRDSD